MQNVPSHCGLLSLGVLRLSQRMRRSLLQAGRVLPQEIVGKSAKARRPHPLRSREWIQIKETQSHSLSFSLSLSSVPCQTPEKKLAYERGEGVYWTSGILGPNIQKKSLSPGLQTQMQRNVIFASGRPATWHFDDVELNKQSPMTPRTLQVRPGHCRLTPTPPLFLSWSLRFALLTIDGSFSLFASLSLSLLPPAVRELQHLARRVHPQQGLQHAHRDPRGHPWRPCSAHLGHEPRHLRLAERRLRELLRPSAHAAPVPPREPDREGEEGGLGVFHSQRHQQVERERVPRLPLPVR